MLHNLVVLNKNNNVLNNVVGNYKLNYLPTVSRRPRKKNLTF